MKKVSSGQFGNLYYHDSDGKVVFINDGKIKPEGKVSLELYRPVFLSGFDDFVWVCQVKCVSFIKFPYRQFSKLPGLSSKVCKFYKISLPAVFKAAGFTCRINTAHI